MKKKIRSIMPVEHSIIPIEPLVVGKIGSTYGVRGWMRLFSFTRKADNIFNYQPWFMKKLDKWDLLNLECWKRNHQNWIIKIRNIEDRKSASLLVNRDVIIDALKLPSLNHDEYYWKDIIGCKVITLHFYQLGYVINFIENDLSDWLVVKTNTKDNFGIRKRFIPFLEGKVIKKIDLTTHLIKVDWDPSF